MERTLDNGKQNKDTKTSLSSQERRYRRSPKYHRQQQAMRKKKFNTIALVAAIVIVTASLGSYLGYQAMYGHIMTVNGQKVSIEEFRFVQALGSGKADAMEQLFSQYTVEKAAADLGVFLTDEERQPFMDDLDEMKSYMASRDMRIPRIKDERMVDFFASYTLTSKLQDILLTDYAIDEQVYQASLADYIANNRQDYVDMQLKYAFTTDEVKAHFVKDLLDEGADPDETIKEYCEDHAHDCEEEHEHEQEVEIIALRDLSLEPDLIEHLLGLEASEVSDVMPLGEDFVVFYVVSKHVPPEAEVKEKYREDYVDREQGDLFNGLMTEWRSALNFQINERAYNAA